VQLCIVHLVRASLNYVPATQTSGGRSAIDLSCGHGGGSAGHLEELERKWKQYPSVHQVWRQNWERITPLFHYPSDIRRAIYTTNAVEALNRSLRKIIKTRGAFPNDDSAMKLLFLALRRRPKNGPCRFITGKKR
jgi:transposase-like protein